jgi:AcrR family transcriptional regulator
MASDPSPGRKAVRRKSSATDDAASPTSVRRQLMENEVIDHATRLFAERGFAGTSLQDVAESMGLKRPALYYYFKSKDELLDRLIAEGVSGPAHDFETIAEQPDLSPAERLHAIVRHNVTWVLTHTDRFQLLVKSESELSPASREKYRASSRAALDTVATVIEQGIEAGQFRPVKARVAALGIFGTCNWAAWWYDPDGLDSVESVADQLADQALAGVQRVERTADAALSPSNALSLLRQDLELLADALDRDRTPLGRSS